MIAKALSTHKTGVTCLLCPKGCCLAEGQRGACKARIAQDGAVVAENYGRLTSLCLDPIEKKPFAQFHPGSMVLSLGSYGCNLACPFCQNADISQAGCDDVAWREFSPTYIAQRALELTDSGNIGIAFTYNEPFIGYEFLIDTAKLAHQEGLCNVVVTNGLINEDPLNEALPHLDALNIDLKCFSQEGYDKLGGGHAAFACVKRTIQQCAASAHVEVTTLVIPGFNDSEEEIAALAQWVASINPHIPLHISRFFPRYAWSRIPATPVAQVYRLAEVARQYLAYVYTGNC